MKIRIGTRGSKLALWQAKTAEEMVRKAFPNAEVEIVIVKTEGDKDQKSSLKSIGGYGVFVKTIENELLNHKVDIAVHSAKDMPASMDTKLAIAATPPREKVNDVMISRYGVSLIDLPQNSVIGTSSARRQAQVKSQRHDFKIREIRGNVETRMKKVSDGDFEATLLAYAGVKRLGLEKNITEIIDLDEVLPAPGQGIVVIQCRKEDKALMAGLQKVSDRKAYDCLMAERALLRRLEAGCHAAVAGYAWFDNGTMMLKSRVLSVNGEKKLQAQGTLEKHSAPEKLGYSVADALISMGAKKLLKEAN